MIRIILVSLIVTLVSCTSPPLDVERVCRMSPAVGSCRAKILRYFFNHETKACETFTYGGCEGNPNNFQMIEECEAACLPLNVSARSVDEDITREADVEIVTMDDQNPCSLLVKIGDCRAAHPRVYFNRETGQCEPFTYGGCNGNSNNFLTTEECESRCGPRLKKESEETRPRDGEDFDPAVDCHLPIVVGPCRGLMKRWAFDSASNGCQEFIYGGCHGNKNNFRTQEACKTSCSTQMRV